MALVVREYGDDLLAMGRYGIDGKGPPHLERNMSVAI